MNIERELKERILKLFEETDRRSEEQEAYIQELRQKLSLAEKAKNLEAHGYSHPAASIVKQDVTKNAMMPAMVNHDYRNIKIDASTTVTIDLEDIKKQLAEDFYRSQGLGIYFKDW